MSIVIIHGAIGSGKTDRALELVDDYIFYNESIGTGDLRTKKTLIVDNADRLKKDVLKKIIKFTKGNLILTITDLNAIDKSIKSNAKKISTGKIDKRKDKIIKQYPNSAPSCVYDPNIFKVLEAIYSNPDRAFVNQMLNDIKPNVYGLMLWLYENGDLELLQYIDKEQLFKMKPKFLYSTLAYGIKPKPRRINWPRKSASEKIDDEVKKHFGLRKSDVSILNFLEIPKIKKPKSKKAKVSKPKKLVEKKTGFDAW